ncbi:ABC transporter substrate-binding protein [Halomarina oriensis]|uniref:ABC transporter substrate-binding protein n=2 Tax=Halomarina oriensis TaxID=671145 RepID=A0A6B0GQ34_9EURY|nr:ABC transporter substrate-binding protein [Halomarina oriensis]
MEDSITRRTLLGAVGAGGFVSIAGCAGDSGDGGGNDDPYSSETKTGDGSSTDNNSSSGNNSTATGGSANVALSMDPTEGVWQVYGGVSPYYTNILEPLIWVSEEMKLEPWLATDWEATSDTTWEFTLRDSVKFHNGEDLVAEHVVWSFEQVLNEWSYAPGWLHVESGSVTAIDETTVEFETSDPFPTFPGTIAHNMIAIQHPDRSRENTEPIGTGPYQVEQRTQGQHVRTSGFDDYWNGTPSLDELTFSVITDPNTRALSLQNGDVDVAFDPPKSRVEKLDSNGGTNVTTQLSPGAVYVGCNIYKAPMDDPKLRQALNYATSQSDLVETILSNIGVPAKGPVAESIFWSAHEKLPAYEQDTEKAKQLVEESSYDGEALQFHLSNQQVDGELLAQALQQWYDEIGVNVDIQVTEEASFEDTVRSGEPHLILESSGTNSGAADYLIYETFHSEGDVNERLYNEEGTGIYNLGEEVDQLIQAGFQTGDQAEKEQKYEQALQRIMEEAVVVPINYSEYIVAASDGVSSMDLRPIPEMTRWTGLQTGQ